MALNRRLAPEERADDTVDGYEYQCPTCGVWLTTRIRAKLCTHGLVYKKKSK